MKPVDKVILSDIQDRVIYFGIEEVDRYITGEEVSDDPWWNIYVFVKKTGIEINAVTESMTKSELIELSMAIRNADNRDEHISFMEPDYSFVISNWRGVLHINMKYTDSLNIWLSKENLRDLANYIERKINK